MELLFRVRDLADEDGWVTSPEVAEAIGLDHPHPSRCVSSRFAWLRRYGTMEREGRRWRLSQAGVQLVEAVLRKQQRTVLEGMDDAQLFHAMRVMGTRYVEASVPSATLMRREWKYQSYFRRPAG